MSVCIGVTLLPILLRVVFGMILLGLQNQSLLLPPAVIREMMFVLLADFSMVAGGILILIVYPILNKNKVLDFQQLRSLCCLRFLLPLGCYLIIIIVTDSGAEPIRPLLNPATLA